MQTSNQQKEILAQLSEGIKELSSSKKWQEYLKFQTVFHNYSFSNVLLILKQCPDATHVAGYNAWKKLDRHVRKGEKAISILAPIFYRQVPEANEKIASENEKRLCGFKTVKVFDISQTEGRPIPSPCQNLTEGNYDSTYSNLIETADLIGFMVREDKLPEGINGNCSHQEKLITINCANSSPQKVKTLSHELGHAILHDNFDNRPVAELEAESVAYVVCSYLGIDSGLYSFGYILSWASGDENAVQMIKTSCERIQKASESIIKMLSVQTAKVAA